jgi:hypothetical protein
MDKYSYRVVITSISLSALIFAIGSVILALKNSEIPEQLVALGVASFGILGGLLAPSPK